MNQYIIRLQLITYISIMEICVIVHISCCCKQATHRKMKLSIILSILIPFISFGQKDLLNDKGNSIKEIISKNWKILNSKKGDLNNDGILDLVFAIQNTDPNNIKNHDGLGSDKIDLNPRILGIYFGSKYGSFEQKLISKDFIILKDSPTMDEPLDNININKKGILEIDFRFWYSAGSWSMSNHTYKFRYQNDDFRLIGYESNESHRGTGETTDYSVNFLTNKMKITKGNFSKDEPESIKWKKFILKDKLTIRTLKKPFELEFEGFYL